MRSLWVITSVWVASLLAAMPALAAKTPAQAASCNLLIEYGAASQQVMTPSTPVNGFPSWFEPIDEMVLKYSTVDNRWEIYSFTVSYPTLNIMPWYFDRPAAEQEQIFEPGRRSSWFKNQGLRLDYVTPDCGPGFNVPARFVAAAVDATGAPRSTPALAQFFANVVVTDDHDGVISSHTHNAPNQFPLGETPVTFEAVNARGVIGRAQTIIDIQDQTKPDIQLNGPSAMTVNHGDVWGDPGAIAFDRVDGNLSHAITVSGTVNTALVAVYPVVYSVQDVAGNIATVTRHVTVQDRAAPVVSAPAPIVLAAVDAHGVPASDTAVQNFLNGGIANDAVDGSLAVQAAFSSTHLHIGISYITFQAIDAAGNLGTATSSIMVTDQHAPVLTLLGDASMIVTLGQTYVEPGVLAIDNVDGDISNFITTSGTVDTQVAGLYQLNYRIIDSAGNVASINRGISVQDRTAPVITPPADLVLSIKGSRSVANTDTAIQTFLSGATVIDDVDGSSLSITHNAPVNFPLGVTTVQFSAVDSGGNVGYAQASVTINKVAENSFSLSFQGAGGASMKMLLLITLLMWARSSLRYFR